MQNLFVKESDTFEVKLFVAVDEKGGILCDITSEGVKQLMGTNSFEIKEYSIIFRKPCFGDFIDISKGTILVNTTSNDISIDPTVNRYKTMITLMKDWNLLEEDGKKIPLTEENIRKLHPVIATAIGVQMTAILAGVL